MAFNWQMTTAGACMLAFAGTGAAEEIITSQDSKLNVGIVVTQGDDNSNIEMKQEGRQNIALTFQFHKNNRSAIEQGGPSSAAYVFQKAPFPEPGGPISGVNQAFVFQDGPDADIGDGHDGTHFEHGMTDLGYLIEFRSGDVDIFSLTEPGSVRVSSFGRSH